MILLFRTVLTDCAHKLLNCCNCSSCKETQEDGDASGEEDAGPGWEDQEAASEQPDAPLNKKKRYRKPKTRRV